jgi:predicted nucleic acid-binding protein
MIVVSNASPLIILSGISQLEILKQIFQKVFIPQEVYAEVAAGGGMPGAREINSSFLEVRSVSMAISPVQDRHRIGKGEAATIILAREMKAELVIMDDKRAREAAKTFDLNLVGSLRVLELGFEKGLITDLKTVYQDLLQSRARIVPQLIEHSLAKYGL